MLFSSALSLPENHSSTLSHNHILEAAVKLSSSALAFVLSSIREKDPSRHSPNSLRITAIFFPCWVVRMWVSKVVLPAEEIFSRFSFEPWKDFLTLERCFFTLERFFLPWKGVFFTLERFFYLGKVCYLSSFLPEPS